MAIKRSASFKEMSAENVYTDDEIILAIGDKKETARKIRAAQKRRMLCDNLRDIIDAELRSLFVEVSYNAIRKYIDVGQNLFLRVMKEISLVYQREPERTLEDGDAAQQGRLDEITQEQHLDLALARANFLLNGLNDLVLQPMVVGNTLSLAMFTPDQVTILGNKMDPSIPEALVFEEKYTDPAGNLQSKYTFWSPTRHFALISDPGNSGKYLRIKINEKDANPYSEVNKKEGSFYPFVFCHATYRDYGFWDEHTNASLYEATVLIALQNTFKNFMVPQQFKQLAVKMLTKGDGGGWINDQVSNPLHIFQTNGDITVLDWQSAIDKLDIVIQNKVAQVANDYGISAEQIKLEISAQSGFSRLVAKERIYELRDEQIKFWRIYERDMYDANRAANNLYLSFDYEIQRAVQIELPEEVVFTVDFAEPKMLVDPKEDLEVKQKEIDMGLISPVDLIMAKNPDIETREKALELYKRNLEERAAVEGLGGFRTPSLKDLSGNNEVKAGAQSGKGA